MVWSAEVFSLLSPVARMIGREGCDEEVAEEVMGWVVYTNPAMQYELRSPKGWEINDIDKKGEDVRLYPKGKELSLVARTFLDFAIEYESIISKRMESIWPALKTQFDNNKKLKTTKKNAK